MKKVKDKDLSRCFSCVAFSRNLALAFHMSSGYTSSMVDLIKCRFGVSCSVEMTAESKGYISEQAFLMVAWSTNVAFSFYMYSIFMV